MTMQTMFACINFKVLECNNSYNIPVNVSFTWIWVYRLYSIGMKNLHLWGQYENISST